MLVGNQIFTKIDEIVDKSYLGFMFYLLGDDFFTDEQKRKVEALGRLIGNKPLIELLYLLVRQRSTVGYRRDATLNQLLDEIAATGILPIINDTNQYTIDHAKQQMMEVIEDTKADLKKRIKNEILKVNSEYKTELSVSRLQNLPKLRETREKLFKGLIKDVLKLAPVVIAGFAKSFATAFTNFINNGAVDAATITTFLNPEGKDPEVYKTVVNDGDLCSWCAKFYRNKDGSPKIYKLSELQKNGSNYGKPKSEWKPTVESTHIRCRCQLHYR